MPETVILNASVRWDEDIKDSIAPDYGFTNEDADTRVYAKAPAGRPYSREVQNAGSTFQLSWLNRSYKCTQRIRRFWQQYQDGYFTIIDHDGGGRHYVGRFTGKFPRSQKGNDRYDITDLTFETVPGVPMLKYPSDWERDSIQLRVQNDFGDQYLATTGTWTAGATPAFPVTMENEGNAGETATMEYRGYGYQLWLQKGPNYGQVSLLLDGVLIVPLLDLYAAAAMGPQPVSINSQVPLDIHRLTVNVLGTKNAASSSAAVSWCMLQVMR